MRETQSDDVSYDDGQQVLVMSPNFEPTCQQGTVVEDHGVDLDVQFDTNPWGDSGGPTEVAVLRDQVVPANPDQHQLDVWASNLSEFGDE
jgi:hypothetical protein